jgi:hypothetical protein
MLKRYGTCVVICLISVVIGVVVGGCIVAAAPQPNHIFMKVMPYGDVNVAPEPGDIVEWSAYDGDPSQTLSINFQHDSPCTEANGSDSCTLQPDTDAGIFLYSCAGQATCPDPGVGPHCKGCPGGQVKRPTLVKKLVKKLVQTFEDVVLYIDRALGFITTEVHPSVLPEASLAPATVRQVPAQVYCNNGVTAVDPPNVGQSAGQSIYWVGKTAFTLDIPQAVCSGDTSTPSTLQQCKVVSAASPVTAYHATINSCATTPAANLPTITSH